MKKIPTRKIDASAKTPPRRIFGIQRGSSKTYVNGRRKSNCSDEDVGGGGGSAEKAEDIQRSVARSVTWKKTGPAKLLRDYLVRRAAFRCRGRVEARRGLSRGARFRRRPRVAHHLLHPQLQASYRVGCGHADDALCRADPSESAVHGSARTQD